ncbi:unnamed protein product [Rangifer tarandus platyrhynchus]|uniref:Uncharacterized protein n=1 Tax=Rangifer tarandus platyrhynchus TaxID=3082113 RepID=A0AC59Z3J8_RANTA
MSQPRNCGAGGRWSRRTLEPAAGRWLRLQRMGSGAQASVVAAHVLSSSFLLAEMGGGRPDTPKFEFAEAGIQQLPCAAPFEVRGRHPVVEMDNAINRLGETEQAGTQFSRWIFIYIQKNLSRDRGP